ncbi:MAG: hypothetical protein EZS28_036327, partial [Streblomastix strix]
MIILILSLLAVIFGDVTSQIYPTPIQTIPHKLNTNHIPDYQASNAACQWRVSKSYSITNTSARTTNTVTNVLGQTCTEGYEITLEDSTHFESVSINKTSSQPVLIKGRSDLRTIWSLNSTAGQIIRFYERYLTLQNLEFNYVIGSGNQVWPTSALIYYNNSATLYAQLYISKCYFNGLTNLAVGQLISITHLQMINVSDCIFQNARVNSDSAVYLWTLDDRSDVLFENTRGFESGGIWATFQAGIQFNFSFNEFSENKNNNSIAPDVQLRIYNYPQGWTKDNHKSKLIQTFEGSTSISRNSVYYEIIVDYTTDVYGNIDLAQGSEYCQSKAQLTPQCICNEEFTSYPQTQCEQDKLCTFNLINQSNATCPCLNTSDPRAGKGQCPAYCVKGQVTANCACDSNITGYTVQQCQQEKLCITNLVNQTAANCPCLSTGDPRAGKGQCPAYCIGPDNPTSDCVCDSNPNAYYPPQTCQSNKKC